MNGAPKNSAALTAILNRSKCSGHGSVIFTFPTGEPMLATPMPLAVSLDLISARKASSKSSTFLPATPRSSRSVTPICLQTAICSSRLGEISSVNPASFNMPVAPVVKAGASDGRREGGWRQGGCAGCDDELAPTPVSEVLRRPGFFLKRQGDKGTRGQGDEGTRGQGDQRLRRRRCNSEIAPIIGIIDVGS